MFDQLAGVIIRLWVCFESIYISNEPHWRINPSSTQCSKQQYTT